MTAIYCVTGQLELDGDQAMIADSPAVKFFVPARELLGLVSKCHSSTLDYHGRQHASANLGSGLVVEVTACEQVQDCRFAPWALIRAGSAVIQLDSCGWGQLQRLSA